VPKDQLKIAQHSYTLPLPRENSEGDKPFLQSIVEGRKWTSWFPNQTK